MPVRLRLLPVAVLALLAAPAAASAATVPYDTPGPTRNPNNALVSYPTAPSPGPSVTGTAQVGGTLTGSRGTWPGSSVTSEWLRCNVGASTCETTGDTDLQYSPGPADVGLQIKLRVVGRRTQTLPLPGSSTRTVDAGSAAIAANPLIPSLPRNVQLPRITGEARQGRTLGMDLGQWTGTDPISYSTTWASCVNASCRQVATGSTYTVRSGDVGRTILLAVGASNAVGRAWAFAATGTVVGPLTGLKRLSPFPTLLVNGRVAGAVTRISTLRLRRVPGGATVNVACTGRGCPFRKSRVRVRGGKSRTVALRRLQRRIRAGAVVVITVRKGDTIGKYIRLRFRRASAPARVDRCVIPKSSKPVKCP